MSYEQTDRNQNIQHMAYLNSFPAGRKWRFDSIRNLITQLYADAVESMRYKMPTYEWRPAMQMCRFIQCDVFTPIPTPGNALAHRLPAEDRLDAAVTVAQRTIVGRHGRVSIGPVDSHHVKIGGQTHILIEAGVFL